MTTPDAIQVHVRLSNNGLTQRRVEAGWTRAQLAAEASHYLAAMNVDVPGDSSTVMAPLAVATYERLRRPPRRKDGEWKRQARAIASALGVLPEDLWPPVVERIATPATTRTLTAQAFEAYALAETERRQLPAPDEVVDDLERRRAVDQALAGLTPRERRVIERRFGFGCEKGTHDEIGAEFDVSRERIRQLEAKALRKLQHPRLAAALTPWRGEDP